MKSLTLLFLAALFITEAHAGETHVAGGYRMRARANPTASPPLTFEIGYRGEGASALALAGGRMNGNPDPNYLVHDVHWASAEWSLRQGVFTGSAGLAYVDGYQPARLMSPWQLSYTFRFEYQQFGIQWRHMSNAGFWGEGNNFGEDTLSLYYRF